MDENISYKLKENNFDQKTICTEDYLQYIKTLQMVKNQQAKKN